MTKDRTALIVGNCLTPKVMALKSVYLVHVQIHLFLGWKSLGTVRGEWLRRRDAVLYMLYLPTPSVDDQEILYCRTQIPERRGGADMVR